MPDEIRDLLDISLVIERYPDETRHRMVQYLVGKYGLMPVLAREYERTRKAEQRTSGYVPDTVPDIVPAGGVSPTPVVRSTAFRSSPKAPKVLLSDEARDKAKGLLKPADFEFLQACPEPFRTQWLGDADWWVSLLDGYPRINAQREASKCMSYVQSKFKPGQLERLNLRERLRRWVAKADMWRQSADERQAVRR